MIIGTGESVRMGAAAALEKLLPVLLAFGGGVFLARRKTVPAEASKAFADYAFLFAVPCYLFGNIYASDLGALFDWRAIGGYAAAAALAAAVVALVAVARGTREPRAVALRVMAGVQVNTAYFAVPVFITVFGTAAPIFPVLLFQVCVLSLVVIAIMELGRSGPGTGGPRTKLARAVAASLATPLVLACNAGIVLNLLSVRVPGVVLEGAAFVGDSASPVALFALGLHLGGAGLDVRGTTREELLLIGFKCLAFPLLAWAVCGWLFGVRGDWLAYLVLIAAMPTPQNLFIFAQRYDVGVDLSASLVIKSSMVSLLLLPLWLQTVVS
ncbi:AEC family transporter [Streptomyces sp. NPDC054949]|uniref:AEC family transporter n=1 Tax=unclassified Streptomyces TaxID=2593676 RepID=UPI00225785FA|nr:MULTISPECIES: AEC family transporter [unclassified Streptomyces]MCX5072031.1 AEC family transporter [Streptomyces sp. NBC_00424]MCX5157526.1 AEC family transporter [Streptomyces sp. NBC_00291]WUD44605.1 AEC family transporter [Streptomyces sp. NBC_00513]